MTYNIFISHSWTYDNHYETLIKKLRDYPYFDFRDYSVPKNDPIHNARNATALKEAIRHQMRYASIVLIMAGVYSTYSKWINIEIDIAKNEFTPSKSILAITPFGAERISTVVRDAATAVVKWRTDSIVDAIRAWG